MIAIIIQNKFKYDRTPSRKVDKFIDITLSEKKFAKKKTKDN